MKTSWILCSVVLMAGCNRDAESSGVKVSITAGESGESAPRRGSESQAQSGGESRGSSGAKASGAGDDAAHKPGTAAEVDLVNGKRSVKTDTDHAELRNKDGKQGVDTNTKGTTLTGRDGKSVTIPFP